MKQLVIAGTGLFAEVAKAYFHEFTNYRVAAFACHQQYKERDEIYGCPLVAIEGMRDALGPAEVDVFVAIGYGKMNHMRKKVLEELQGYGYDTPSFVHPGVKIWSTTTLGRNVFIFEDNTIQPFTSIGDGTVLWSGNHVGHHSKIGRYCFISSHVVVSGSCVIGDNSFIGVNATLKDGITIGDQTLIGPGSLIMRDTKPKEVYMPERTEPHRLTSDRLMK